MRRGPSSPTSSSCSTARSTALTARWTPELVRYEALGCDVYLLSSYKLFSKVGASVAYLSDRIAALPHDKLLGKPKTHWELGTREQAGYAAWSEVVGYLCWLGRHFTKSTNRRGQITAAMHAVELHERALTGRMLRIWIIASRSMARRLTWRSRSRASCSMSRG